MDFLRFIHLLDVASVTDNLVLISFNHVLIFSHYFPSVYSYTLGLQVRRYHDLLWLQRRCHPRLVQARR